MKRAGGNELRKGGKFLNKLNSVIMILALAGILVLLNAIADQLPWTYDMTAEKIFTLSEQTKKVIHELKKPVNIVAFFREGSEDRMVKTLLEEYRKTGRGKLALDYIDAEKNPAVAKKYDLKNEGISNGTIIFECEGKVKQVNQFDLVSTNGYGKSFDGEQLFTGAIINLTAQKFRKVYFLEGHQEMNFNEDLSKLKSRLENEAHVTESLNLLKANSVPADADVLVIASPKRDLNHDEKVKLQDFLEKGGRAVLMFDILSPDTELPNFNDLLKGYGVSVKNNFVVEEDGESYYSNNKMYLVPDYLDQSIVAKLKADNLFVLFPYAGNLDLLKENPDPAVTVEPLLQTTAKSWIRYNVKDATAQKTGQDVSGPAKLAVAVRKDNMDLKYPETKLIVTFNAKFAVDSMIDMQGNYDFLMNAFSWVEDNKESMAVRPKMLDTNRLFVKGTLSVVLMVMSILVIPMIAFGAGLIVWMRRRHL